MHRDLGITDRKGTPIKESDILFVGENIETKVVWVGKNVDVMGDEIHCAYHLEIIEPKSQKGDLIPIDSYALDNCVVKPTDDKTFSDDDDPTKPWNYRK